MIQTDQSSTNNDNPPVSTNPPVTKSTSNKIYQLQNLPVTKSTGYNIHRLQNSPVTKSISYKIDRLQNRPVTKSISYKIHQLPVPYTVGHCVFYISMLQTIKPNKEFEFSTYVPCQCI